MNKSYKYNRFLLWLIVALITLLVFVIFYNLLTKDHLEQYLGESSPNFQEKCVDCHTPSGDMSSWHAYDRIGCVSCHMGNPEEGEMIPAHTDMINIPGNLSNSKQSCGSIGCHPGISERVEGSLMTSMSGVVNIQRYVFGESDTLNAHAHVKDLTHSPADSYTRNLCASCHLGREKLEFGPVGERTRGGGCTACHLNYSEAAKKALSEHRDGEAQHFHPSLDLKITNDHCFGCHARSGRISTSYEGWHETRLKELPIENSGDFRKMEDKRILEMIQADIHHELGLDCIDCHNGLEVMGDGQKYYHAEDAVMVKCVDCHFKNKPESVPFSKLDYESQKIVQLRPQLTEDMNFVIGQQSNYPLVNVIEEGNDYFLIGKINKKKHPLSPIGEACQKGEAHNDLTCSACHTSWTPQCIKCHVEFDPNKRSFDLLDRKSKDGKWIEEGDYFLAEAPTLGIMEGREGKRAIQVFVPGMILDIDTSDYSNDPHAKKIFDRLYAPLEAHTTRKEVRDCKSCHLDPNTLGYGRGELNYNLNRKQWSFSPKFPLRKEDKLPEDAWIGLMEEAKTNRTTRVNGRPFNLEEQKRILIFGTCLKCHDDNETFKEESLSHFDSLLQAGIRSKECLFN